MARIQSIFADSQDNEDEASLDQKFQKLETSFNPVQNKKRAQPAIASKEFCVPTKKTVKKPLLLATDVFSELKP